MSERQRGIDLEDLNNPAWMCPQVLRTLQEVPHQDPAVREIDQAVFLFLPRRRCHRYRSAMINANSSRDFDDGSMHIMKISLTFEIWEPPVANSFSSSAAAKILNAFYAFKKLRSVPFCIDFVTRIRTPPLENSWIRYHIRKLEHWTSSSWESVVDVVDEIAHRWVTTSSDSAMTRISTKQSLPPKTMVS